MIKEVIPFNKACIVGNEQKYVAEAVASGDIAGDHDYTKKCHEFLQKTIGVPKVLLTTSCTHALEMTALLLDIKPGDEVILPSFTFVSTVNAYVLRGAKPVFCDIRPDTLNIDEKQIEKLITKKTKAIVIVHYAGVACAMDEILALAKKYNLAVVEDNAHGLFGTYKGRNLGTFGTFATQSFHETKNITCGEGGALFINDLQYAERAEIIREKGTNRSRFFRGQVDKYTWVDIGSSYLPSEILAAYLLGQLEEYQKIQNKRKKIWESYNTELTEWAEQNNVRLPIVPPECGQTYHMFYLLLPDLENRQRFIAYMKENKITCVFHYLPLHLSDMGLKFGGKPGDHPITEKVSDQLVRLPLYYEMTDAELNRVIETIRKFEV